ncbi:hypothetical protein [Bogoriella caseilytica]|uniref:Uncharacterized protein n=1 Tax=Bogoriella caseilytica TaxID=56055 RepID=A0A3N2B9G8_9MICO|nr:hypothetical protein [Bogoriella caseilytica]ROR71900.1 hypothetical protein EDD31_0239 [Bogoriella caseilytica]
MAKDSNPQEPQPSVRKARNEKGGSEAERRPEQQSGMKDPLEAPPADHGEEGGGDPAAGAQQDATGSGGEIRPSGPDGGHRSGREGGL